MSSNFFKKLHYFAILASIITLVILTQSRVYAEGLEEIEREIGDLQEQLGMSVSATENLESSVADLKKKIEGIQAQITKAEEKQEKLSDDIEKREEALKRQYVVLANKVRDYYKKSRSYSPFLVFVSSRSASELTRGLAYKQVTADEDKNFIVQMTRDILQLEEDRDQVARDRQRLTSLQTKLDEQKNFFEGEIAGAKAWQEELRSKIATLTAKQQQLLEEKYGSLNLPESLGAGSLYCTDDRELNPGFSPAFAFYTYGIPHRVGMNQYGAYGRAKASQGYDAILRAYYNFDDYQDRGGVTIRVNDGNGVNQGNVIWSGSLEEYVKRIYEMPAGWGDEGAMEALKAQAIAAQSYALAATNNGSQSICANQHCQVFKTDPKGGAWENAVTSEEVAGKVMVTGGETVKAWYASTSGGYTFFNSDIWGGSRRPWTKRLRDTAGGVSSFSELQAKSYDRESPCFYAAQGWRSEYDNSAWLKSEEVVDIVNVILLAREDSSTKEHLYQTDEPHPYGGEVWDEARVREELRNRGITPLTSVSDVDVGNGMVDWEKGVTNNIKIDGRLISGSEFSDWFNLRAPANIQIVGPLFDVEKK